MLILRHFNIHEREKQRDWTLMKIYVCVRVCVGYVCVRVCCGVLWKYTSLSSKLPLRFKPWYMQVEKNYTCHFQSIQTRRCLLLYHPYHVCESLRHILLTAKLQPAALFLYHLASADCVLTGTHPTCVGVCYTPALWRCSLLGAKPCCLSLNVWQVGKRWCPPPTSAEGTAYGWTFVWLV